ncbi:MAG: DNA-directed RNA polymerase subunit omega [Desulfobulbaceae bacterium]|nr:DNA-directed RNA polymerase subunit omega [Desulfobulbaceae bacterium]HIJ77749.1 DNA-directed RNA polymerase subunit omega [Deltaproteobacteria bacterium]
MARITVEDCLSRTGNENRFALIHLAIERVKQHRKGQPFLVECKNKEIVATLREIASGDVSFDNILEYRKKDKAVVAEKKETIERTETDD